MRTPQFAESGDRVMLGARLYLTGKTPLLVTAGGENYKHAEITYALWRDLQVPTEDILKIRGRNTATEMRSLAELIRIDICEFDISIVRVILRTNLVELFSIKPCRNGMLRAWRILFPHHLRECGEIKSRLNAIFQTSANL